MNKTQSDMFVEELKSRFDTSVDALDSETVARITRIRYRALAQNQNITGNRFRLWAPLTAIATACVAVIVFTLLPQEPAEDTIFIDEIELISELELYENLEFYEWLDQHELPS